MKYTITKSKSLNGTYTEYAEGDFSSVSSGDKLEILNESVPAGVNYYYKVYLWIDGSTGSQNDMIGRNIELETSTEIIKPITAETLAGKANPESLLYADATDVQKKEMWTFSHEATEQVGATTDYRYIGSSPNNYITFNDETWRIIGVFDGRIKIIRQDSLGNMSRDYNHSGASFYTFERGTMVYGTNPTNWSGYVGLAYSSDYIYTFANGVDETCFNNGSKCTTPGAVPTSSWMVVMKGVTSWWLITLASGWDNYVYEIGNGDYSGASYVYNTYNIHSVLYLKLEVELTVEETSGNPYQIQ